MEVQRAGSESCSWLYRQKFEDRCLARAEKRRKAGSNFIAGCKAGSREKQDVQESCKTGSGSLSRLYRAGSTEPALQSRLYRAGSRKLSRLF
ncbi:hypothetical protein SLEP1_g49615 [Rubroshorea leprosula]|uniref:Uncharacterized protein n=1 Tax=Rubroshorea leprosula TaxID=152421 RepID=A0AAV5LYB5_9ROSI|nr:hypothetical protein SLEP1_g49615 [Rubroshorea leprosula]